MFLEYKGKINNSDIFIFNQISVIIYIDFFILLLN